MKNKKALLCGFLALLIFFALSGCAGDTNTPDEAEDIYSEAPGESNEQDDAAEPYDDASNPNNTSESYTNTSEPFDGEFYFSLGLDENGFWQGIRVLDYMEIFDYQAIQIPAEVHEITEEDVQEVIDGMLSEHIWTEQITDREVSYGDTLNIDFVGSVDGVEFDGGSTFDMGMYVTIGVTQFIDDFLYQLIGHMPGTVVNVEVTFPDDYFEASLQGSDALFITTINYINGDEIVPELTDEFVSEHLSHFQDVATVDELFENIQSFLHTNAIQQYIHEYISTQVVIDPIPEQLITYFTQMMLQQYAQQAMQFGMEIEDIIGMFYGFDSVEDFIEDSREDIESQARFSLVFQAVAEDVGITADVQDVADFFIEHFGSDDFSMFEEMYGLPWLKQFIRNQMVMDYISENVELL